jgi:hypothetical protein
LHLKGRFAMTIHEPGNDDNRETDGDGRQEEPGRTPGQAEGKREKDRRDEKKEEPGRTPGQAEGE